MLAIDPSLNSLGFAYRRDGEAVTGTIQPGGYRGMYRLAFHEQQLAKLLDTVRPALVVYENYAMGIKGGGRVFDMGEQGGVLKKFIWERGIDIILVPPSNLKMFVSGKGNADKDTVMNVLAQHRGRSFKNSDEADAYGLLLCGEAFCDRRLLPRVRGHYKRAAVEGFEVVRGKR